MVCNGCEALEKLVFMCLPAQRGEGAAAFRLRCGSAPLAGESRLTPEWEVCQICDGHAQEGGHLSAAIISCSHGHNLTLLSCWLQGNPHGPLQSTP